MLYHPLQAKTEIGRRIEKLRREKEKGKSLTDIMNSYNVQPSPEDILRDIKKSKEFRDLNKVWRENGYTQTSCVGKLMDHRKQYAHLSCSEWCEQYFQDHSYASFNALALRIAVETGVSRQFALDALSIRVILETSDGYELEQKTLKLCEQQFIQQGTQYTVRYASSIEDRKYAIDNVIEFCLKPFLAIQVKPNSYFFRKPHLFADQRKNLNANYKWQELTGCPVFYVRKSDIENEFLNLIPLSEVEKFCVKA